MSVAVQKQRSESLLMLKKAPETSVAHGSQRARHAHVCGFAGLGRAPAGVRVCPSLFTWAHTTWAGSLLPEAQGPLHRGSGLRQGHVRQH